MSMDEYATELDGAILCADGLILRHGHTFEGREWQYTVTVPWAAVRAVGASDDNVLWLDVDARPEEQVDGYLPIARYLLESPEEAMSAADVAAEIAAAWESAAAESLGGAWAAWYRPAVQLPELDRLALEDGLITDGYGMYVSVTCPECGGDSMEFVRPGAVQCWRCR